VGVVPVVLVERRAVAHADRLLLLTPEMRPRRLAMHPPQHRPLRVRRALHVAAVLQAVVVGGAQEQCRRRRVPGARLRTGAWPTGPATAPSRRAF
jgi:hypothetical protein